MKKKPTQKLERNEEGLYGRIWKEKREGGIDIIYEDYFKKIKEIILKILLDVLPYLNSSYIAEHRNQNIIAGA